MHEFSIANQAVDKIIAEALKKGAKRIQEVEILIGELNLHGEDQFLFWMKELLGSKGEIGRDVKINLKLQKAKVICNQCGYEGNLKAKDEACLHHLYRCPSCNQEDLQVKTGRECVLKRIKLEM